MTEHADEARQPDACDECDGTLTANGMTCRACADGLAKHNEELDAQYEARDEAYHSSGGVWWNP